MSTLADVYKLAFTKVGATDGWTGGYTLPLFSVATPPGRTKPIRKPFMRSRLSRSMAPHLPGGLADEQASTWLPPNERYK